MIHTGLTTIFVSRCSHGTLAKALIMIVSQTEFTHSWSQFFFLAKLFRQFPTLGFSSEDPCHGLDRILPCYFFEVWTLGNIRNFAFSSKRFPGAIENRKLVLHSFRVIRHLKADILNSAIAWPNMLCNKVLCDPTNSTPSVRIYFGCFMDFGSTSERLSMIFLCKNLRASNYHVNQVSPGYCSLLLVTTFKYLYNCDRKY